jgi:aspartate aminotransferase
LRRTLVLLHFGQRPNNQRCQAIEAQPQQSLLQQLLQPNPTATNMQPKLSQLSETLIGSEIVRLGNEISQRIKAGERIFNYTIGDFNPAIFPIPKALEDCIVEAYKNHFTNYPVADGEMDLRKAVAAFILQRQDIEFAANEILIGAGGRPLIYALYRAICDKGDKVIYPVPSWNNNHYVHFNQAEHVIIETKPESNFLPTAADIAPHIKGATLLSLCSPLNPTGTAFDAEELGKICDLVIEENKHRGFYDKKLYLMYDQMYWTLTFGATQHVNPVSLRPQMKDYTIFIDGISKAFAATGVRVGWAMGPAHVMAKMKAINSHVGAWAPMAEQKAVAKYLLQTANIDQHLQHFKSEVDERLTNIYNGFQALKQKGFAVDAIAPQAAIYLTIRMQLAGKKAKNGTHLTTQEDVTKYILDEAKLAVVPFYAFGAPHSSDWYRLSVGTCKKEEIPEMLEMLEKALLALS